MPVITFTFGELMQAALVEARTQATKVLELSDLERKPFNPGESVSDRYHEIAKAGKKLAEAFAGLDLLMAQAAEMHMAAAGHGDAQQAAPPDTDKGKDGLN